MAEPGGYGFVRDLSQLGSVAMRSQLNCCLTLLQLGCRVAVEMREAQPPSGDMPHTGQWDPPNGIFVELMQNQDPSPALTGSPPEAN